MSIEIKSTNGAVPVYPLIEQADNSLRAANGRPIQELTLEAAASGQLGADDLRIDGQTLKEQATIARQTGYPQLADNLERAAELTMVPNEQLLQMYEMLRPRRATYAELMALASRLDEEFAAQATARMVLDAAEAYQKRDLLKRTTL